MDLQTFLARRQHDQDYAFANGFGNGDPETNGEFRCIARFAPEFDWMIDVGAHKGDFTARALSANPNLNLLLAEANPVLAGKLRDQFPTALLAACAVGEQAGAGVLKVHPEHIGSSSMHARDLMRPDFADKMADVPIDIKRLDDLTPADCGRGAFTKIDVEGWEAAVLRGGLRTLAAGERAAVLFEYSFGWQENGEDLFAACKLLWRHGFEIHRVTPLGLEHVRFFTLDMPHHQYCNYLALRNVALAGVSVATANGRAAFAPWD